MTNELTDESDVPTSKAKKADQEELWVIAISSALIGVSLILVWPYGWIPLLFTLGFTALAFAFVIVLISINSYDFRVSKNDVHFTATLSLGLVPQLVLLGVTTSKWGELLGPQWGIGAGIVGVVLGIVVIIYMTILSSEYQGKQTATVYWSLNAVICVLVMLTASFVPPHVLQFSNDSVTYTTGPGFALPWVHEHPMERPALSGTVTLLPEETQGWKAEIEYTVLHPYSRSSDEWLRYRMLQNSPYIFQAFHDTENPAEAVRQEFMAQYPFLVARVTVVRTVETIWNSPSS